jgi:hypothetical protein
VIPRLKEIDSVVGYAIYKPVLLSDSPRPAAFEDIAKRFGLPDSLKRITHHSLDEVEESHRRISICFDPVSKVFPELLLEYRDTLGTMSHSGSLV